MSASVPPPADLPPDQLEGTQTPATRLAAYIRGGGVIVPALTALLAFVIGGFVVLLTGNDPIATYKAIFEGTGLQWLFPWVTGDDRTTAALNLLWVGVYLFSLGVPLQNDRDASLPVSNDIAEAAHLSVWWGDPILQGLHIGIFIALVAVGIFWLLLNRSTIGYEVRAVGLNPEAARYGGINVARNYVLVMAVCGVFAGLAGAIDVLGWQFRLATNDIQISQIGFFGIAVALLGRNTAIGTVSAALLFGGLLSGTSQRNLDPTIFEPELASNLTLIIQGLVVLMVSADVLVLGMLRRARGLIPRPKRSAA